jgi:hypothetical protein
VDPLSKRLGGRHDPGPGPHQGASSNQEHAAIRNRRKLRLRTPVLRKARLIRRGAGPDPEIDDHLRIPSMDSFELDFRPLRGRIEPADDIFGLDQVHDLIQKGAAPGAISGSRSRTNNTRRRGIA